MSETVRCLDCAHLKLRDQPKMAGYGFGQCAHHAAHEFFSVVYPRQCKWFRQDSADKVQSRVDWYSKKGKS